jgi:hypothetical protein
MCDDYDLVVMMPSALMHACIHVSILNTRSVAVTFGDFVGTHTHTYCIYIYTHIYTVLYTPRDHTDHRITL